MAGAEALDDLVVENRLAYHMGSGQTCNNHSAGENNGTGGK
jgi:hypothetical protein